VLTREGRPAARLVQTSPEGRAAKARTLAAELRALHAGWARQGMKPLTLDETRSMIDSMIDEGRRYQLACARS
jgi:hypothetical protein